MVNEAFGNVVQLSGFYSACHNPKQTVSERGEPILKEAPPCCVQQGVLERHSRSPLGDVQNGRVG